MPDEGNVERRRRSHRHLSNSRSKADSANSVKQTDAKRKRRNVSRSSPTNNSSAVPVTANEPASLPEEKEVMHRHERTSSGGSNASNPTSASLGKKRKTRRGTKGGIKHRLKRAGCNKPDYLMTFEERMTAADQETVRILQRNAALQRAGVAVSPYINNEDITQQHYENVEFSTPRLSQRIEEDASSEATPSEESLEKNDDTGSQYAIRDFEEAFSSVRKNRLESMNKTELIQDFLALEARIETNDNKMRSLASEKMKLQEDNKALVQENFMLRRKLDCRSATPSSTVSRSQDEDEPKSCTSPL